MTVETLGEIRAKYNFWNEKERPYYEALSEAIRILNAQKGKCHYAKIVRCRECKWYEADLYANPWGVCFHEDWVANNIGHTVDEDGFCYRGEREVQE